MPLLTKVPHLQPNRIIHGDLMSVEKRVLLTHNTHNMIRDIIEHKFGGDITVFVKIFGKSMHFPLEMWQWWEERDPLDSFTVQITTAIHKRIKIWNDTGSPFTPESELVMENSGVVIEGENKVVHVCCGIFIGNLANAQNEKILQKHNIKNVLDMTTIQNPVQFKGIEYRRECVPDSPAYDISKNFPSIREFISTSLRKKENVYVHCKHGINRAATAVLAYLIWTDGVDINLTSAFDLLKSVRPIIDINEGFLYALEKEDRIRTNFYAIKNNNIFTRIINDNSIAHVLYTSNDLLVMENTFPKRRIHILIIPKQTNPVISNVDELSSKDLPMLKKMKNIAVYIVKKNTRFNEDFACVFHKRPFLSVPHLHLHVLVGHKISQFCENKTISIHEIICKLETKKESSSNLNS